jgi:hypothetical protein
VADIQERPGGHLMTTLDIECDRGSNEILGITFMTET